jgi:hypothetical protein
MDVNQVIASTDWVAYREAVQDAVRAAIVRYGSGGNTKRENVYQVEVWTDIRARLTAVSFDTLRHALQSLYGRGQTLTEDEIQTFLPTCTGVVYNSDYQYTQFIMVANPELIDLARQDFLDESIAQAICSRVDAELNAAVTQLIDAGEFTPLPHEPGVWFALYTIQSGVEEPMYLQVDD